MTPKQAEEFRYSVLDLTKVWPHKDFPLQEIGKLTLNKNVENYFAEMEWALLSGAREMSLTCVRFQASRVLAEPPDSGGRAIHGSRPAEPPVLIP